MTTLEPTLTPPAPVPTGDPASDTGRPAGILLLLLTCCVVNVAYAAYLGSLGLLSLAIGNAFGVTPAVQGRLSLASFAGTLVSVVIGGALSDRFGRKIVLLGSLGVCVAASGLYRFAPSFGFALLLAPFVGGGGGAMQIAASTLAADLLPSRRAFALNLMQVAFGAGAAVTPLLAGYWLRHGLPWPTLYTAYAGTLLLLLLVVLVQSVPRVPVGDSGLSAAGLKAMVGERAFWLLAAGQTLYAGAEVGFWVWMPTYFTRVLTGGMAWAGSIVTLFWLTMTLGRAATGPLLMRVRLPRLIVGLAVSGAGFALLTLFPTSPILVAVCVCLTGLCFSGIYSAIIAEASLRFPHLVGSAIGSIAAIGCGGAALLPWLIGLEAGGAWGWRGAMGLVPVAALGVAACAKGLGERQGVGD